MDVIKIAIKGTTQEHLSIEDIVDNMVVLKDGSACYVMETSSVNFDLLSEREQEALIYAYAAILNSLSFPIQIFIRSSIKDISSYLRNLRSWEEKTRNPLMRKQIGHYRRFVTEVVEKNNVLTKSFYLVIPFSSFELGLASVKSNFPFPIPWQNKKTNTLPLPVSQIIEKAKANLEPKREHVLRVFSRLGLKMRQLKTKELITLFYGIYNQESAVGQGIGFVDVETPIVSFRGPATAESKETPRAVSPRSELGTKAPLPASAESSPKEAKEAIDINSTAIPAAENDGKETNDNG